MSEETVTEMIERITKDIPKEEWDKLPKNLSEIIGKESDFLALCDCGDAIRQVESKKFSDLYHCFGCDQYWKLVKIGKSELELIE